VPGLRTPCTLPLQAAVRQRMGQHDAWFDDRLRTAQERVARVRDLHEQAAQPAAEDDEADLVAYKVRGRGEG